MQDFVRQGKPWSAIGLAVWSTYCIVVHCMECNSLLYPEFQDSGEYKNFEGE